MSGAASSAFELLHPTVKRWIWQQRWDELREIQERSIPPILAGQTDVLLSAATASGKTEAAFLPLLSRVATQSRPGFRALYLSPLRALINDQFRRLEPLCELLDLPVHRWHGDVPSSRKKAGLKAPAGVVLITPESLEALFVLQGGALATAFAGLEGIIVDECHAYIGSERGAQVQSLLSRLEQVLGRTVQRIGLSATLGDASLAAEYLRPGRGNAVALVEVLGGANLELQLRGYVAAPPKDDDSESDDRLDDGDATVAGHIASIFGSGKNLVFANSRARVELYADRLKRLATTGGLGVAFMAHHGNLSKELREEAEAALRDGERPCTVACTTTLELGIDIGDIRAIAQVGSPPSVSSLRQRLGRSGRRVGCAELRAYVVERSLTPDSPVLDVLRASLVQSVAMIELMLSRWVEPPVDGALHLSTMVQQTLSLIAQRGGGKAEALFNDLCVLGPFRGVTAREFAVFLKYLGDCSVLMQEANGLLLPAPRGEQILNHYSFYAAFVSPEEMTVEERGRAVGTISVSQVLAPGSFLILGGRRWEVEAVDSERKVISVKAAQGGRVPLFDPNGLPVVHPQVRLQMRKIYESAEVPEWLDASARTLLGEGRAAYRAMGLGSNSVVAGGADSLLFHWSGDRVANTLALAFQRAGFKTQNFGVAVVVNAGEHKVRHTFEELARDGVPSPSSLLKHVTFLEREKWDRLVPRGLLERDFALRMTDAHGTLEVARRLVAERPLLGS